MKENFIRISASRIKDTIYIVEHVTGDAAKETASQKIKRLILSDTDATKRRKAS